MFLAISLWWAAIGVAALVVLILVVRDGCPGDP